MPPHLTRRHFLSAGAVAVAVPQLLGQNLPAAAPPTYAPDTLFLTYHADPTTAVTVQWLDVAFDPAAVPVVYRQRGGILDVAAPTTVPVTRKPYPRSDRPGVDEGFADLHVYRAVLSGLTPGAEYEFRLGGRTAAYRFRTMPSKMTDAFHFVSGGDCGIGAAAVASNKIAAKQDPMFALIGGDLGYDNGWSVEASVQFVRNYAAGMTDSQGRLIPMLVCVGNHEVYGGYGKGRADAPFFFALFDGLYADASFATVDFGDYLSLVLLDTGHIAKIEGEQTDWLDRQLAARRDRPHLLVVNHVPAYPSFRAPGDDKAGRPGTGHGNRTHWVPLFEKHRVDAVLEHHDHTFKRTHPLKGGQVDADGIIYLGDGSWGQLRPAKKPEERPYLATTSTSYHLTLHRLEAGQRFHLALEATGKVLDVTRTAKRGRRA